MIFFVNMEPPTVTYQQKKFNTKTKKIYETPEVKDARAKLRAYLSMHVPKEPMEGPLELQAAWLFPITGKHKDGEHKMTKPDCDNMNKLLQDVMAELGFFKNDAQIVRLSVSKSYARIPGIFIVLRGGDEIGKRIPVRSM